MVSVPTIESYLWVTSMSTQKNICLITTIHWKYQIIHDLMNHNMVDTVDLHQDIDDTTPHNTYFLTQPNHNPSRLDLIYVSRDLVVDVLHSNNYQGDMISSDHHAV